MRALILLSCFLIIPFVSMARELPISELTKAIEQSSPENRYRYYHYRALAFLKQNKIDAALNDLNTSIKLFPTTPAYRERGEIHFNNKLYQVAIEDLSRVIKANPNDIPSYKLRSQAYYAKKLYQEALDDSNRVLAHNPKDSTCNVIRMESKAALSNHPKKIVLNPSYIPRRTRPVARSPVRTVSSSKTVYRRKVVKKS